MIPCKRSVRSNFLAGQKLVQCRVNLAWEWRPRENCGDRRHPTKNYWKVPLSRHFVNIENITIVNFALVLCLVVMLHEMKNKALST